MTAVERSVVVAHRIEIVNSRALACLKDIWIHVKAIYRELYLIVDLFG